MIGNKDIVISIWNEIFINTDTLTSFFDYKEEYQALLGKNGYFDNTFQIKNMMLVEVE